VSYADNNAKLWALAGALAVAAVQLLSVLQPGIVEVDGEEMVNAGQALALLDGHWAAFFRLQYRGFCGGCSINSLVGAAWFSVLPANWFVWKLVPTTLVSLFTYVGFLLLDRRVGRRGAWAFVALVFFAPRAWQRLSLIAFGHHFEPGIFAFFGLAVLAWNAEAPAFRRALCAGACFGVAVYAGPTGLFALIAGALWLFWTLAFSGATALDVDRLRRAFWVTAGLLLGACVALILWGLQIGFGGTSPFGPVHYAGDAVPDLWRVPAKLWSVFAPRQLVALFGVPMQPLGWIVGWASAASVLGALLWTIKRGRGVGPMLALFVGSWLFVYAMVRFSLATPDWPEIATHGGVRYAAPVYPFLIALNAVVFAKLWQSARKWAYLVLVPPLVAGAFARAELFRAPFPATEVLWFEPVDFDFFRHKFSYALTLEEHESLGGTERMIALHAYAKGRAAVDSGVAPTASSSRAFLEGFGEGWRDTEQSLSTLLPRLEALGSEQQQVVFRALFGGGVSSQDPVGPPYNLAVVWNEGRDWGASVAGFFDPQVRPVSGAVSAYSDEERSAWVQGFACGLGEEWGPRTSVPTPDGLTPSDIEDFVVGYSEGVSRRWRVSQEQPVAW